MNKEITWQTKFPFGKCKDITLINVLIIDKKYLKWCFRENLQIKYPELKWMLENMTERQMKEIELVR